ncbi:OLC1v1025970C1 [Oldenlandia corymbosa var. corymbosa]|uniref:OLC1v1025970C1 n=1 Tax=Oldenlandia corymbosa var. corymbosa TaxID=529605 RepID=A0AAV1C6C1_OLDCO|nr:OLC1v1025970C1 [Oldenlandia corymbosa var. corymbosa]
MDDFLEEIDCRSKSDAIVMRLLRSAMDKAHENVQSQNGPIEFLHKRSKFYELAAILVDGGLSIVEDEADIFETSREKMLSDLTEIKDWLHRRIEEMQVLIVEKDKELLEREENELKLRHALELNERELLYMQEKLEFERAKSQDLQDFIPSNQEIEDESHGGDFCDLKNSVDQQVLSIKQRLEGEHKKSSSTRRRRASISCPSDNELYFQFLENNRNLGSQFMEGDDLLNHFPGIKPLSSSLKPGKNNAMIQQMSSDIDILKGTLDLAFGRMQNAEVFPLEKQWKWSIERDVLLVSLHGFIFDSKEQFKAEFEKRDCSFPLAFSGVKLKEFINNIRVLHEELKALCSQIKVEEKQGLQEMPAPQSSLQRTTSEPLPDFLTKPPNEDPDYSVSRKVAKLVKNHESFIQKQRKEWNQRTLELLKRKGSSSIKREKDHDELESRIQKAIVVLERLIKWDDSLREGKKHTDVLKASATNSDSKATEDINVGIGADLADEMKKLRQERFDLELQVSLMEDIYMLVFRGSMKNLKDEQFNNETKYSIEDGIGVSMADGQDDLGVTENNNCLSLKVSNSAKETGHDFLQDYLESSIREDVHKRYFLETIMEWNMQMECKAEDCLVEEEILRVILNELIKGIEQSSKQDKCRLEMEVANFSCCVTLMEEIQAVFLRGLFMRWRSEKIDLEIEMLIREDIYQLFMAEMTKEFLHVTVQQIETTERMKEYEENSSHTELEVPDLNEKFNSLSDDHEEVGRQRAGGQIMKFDEKCDEVSEHDIVIKSEKEVISVQQLLSSKAVSENKEYNPDVTIEVSKENDHLTEMDQIEKEAGKQQFSLEPEQDDGLQQDITITLLPLIDFQQAFMEFEHMVHKKLEAKYSRMDKLKHQVSALNEAAVRVREKKLIYKKAFISRCENLSLAETEVDLLGDQVDKLVCLLQNIYLTLHQNSAVLSQNFGVSEIMRRIKKELAEGAAFPPEFVR